MEKEVYRETEMVKDREKEKEIEIENERDKT